MKPRRVALAVGDYDGTRATSCSGSCARRASRFAAAGSIAPEDMFDRFLRNGEFDAAEMSMAAYAALRSIGDERFVALPIFPARSFRHQRDLRARGHDHRAFRSGRASSRRARLGPDGRGLRTRSARTRLRSGARGHRVGAGRRRRAGKAGSRLRATFPAFSITKRRRTGALDALASELATLTL